MSPPRLHMKQRKFSEVSHGIECNKRYSKQIQKVNEFGEHLRSTSKQEHHSKMKERYLSKINQEGSGSPKPQRVSILSKPKPL